MTKALGIEHQVIRVSDGDSDRVLPFVMSALADPPHAHNSLVLWLLVERIASECDLVAFGWGAEMFGSSDPGQIRSYLARKKRLRFLPSVLTRALGGFMRHLPHPRPYAIGDSLVSNETRWLARLDRIYYARAIDMKLNRTLDSFDWLPDETRRYCWDESLDLEARAQKLLQYDFIGSALSRTERLCGAADLLAWSPYQSPAVLSVAQTIPAEFRMQGDVSKPLLLDSRPVIQSPCRQDIWVTV